MLIVGLDELVDRAREFPINVLQILFKLLLQRGLFLSLPLLPSLQEPLSHGGLDLLLDLFLLLLQRLEVLLVR